MSPSFRDGVNLCLKNYPLVKVLRLADGDQKPSMGFLYGDLKKAKEDIKMAFNNVETYYRPIIDDIETRSKGRLDSPLHLIAYLLNPYYFFKDQSIKDDVMVSNAVYAFLEKFFHHDFEKQDQIHSKKRNWLDSQRLNDLVYVQFNAKLINKWARVKNKNIDILRSFNASKAQSWIFSISDDEEIEEDGSLVVGGEAVAVDRELHKDDFVSDEKQVEGGENFEFNSDEEDFT
ncbi:pescadillo-like protein [Tanacetum coccineum]